MDNSKLFNRLNETLLKQGKKYTKEIINDIIEDFRQEQLELMIDQDIDLADLDRWKLLETLVGMKLDFKVAMDIDSKFWDHGVDVLDLNVKEE